jgi:hypothetical protein
MQTLSTCSHRPRQVLIKPFVQGLGITVEAVKAHLRPGTNNFITQVQICSPRCQPVARQMSSPSHTGSGREQATGFQRTARVASSAGAPAAAG